MQRVALARWVLFSALVACGGEAVELDGGVRSDTPSSDAPTSDGGPGPTMDAGPPGTTELVWFSDWRTALGTDQNALYDGGKWNDQLCTSDVAEVVSAEDLGFPTSHAYRSEYGTPGACLMVQVTGAWAPPEPDQYMFVRAYYRNAMVDGAEVGFPHPLHIGRSAVPSASYATWFNFSGPVDGRSGMTLQLGGGPEYPDRFWSFGFRTGETHRIELRIHRLAEDTATVDVRVHDASGALVAESDAWNNGEVGPNLRTLAGSMPRFPVTDDSFTLLELGNNDPAGAVAREPHYVYWGALAVAIGDDPEGWVGAYPTVMEVMP